jgi:signal peptidase I
MFTPRHVKHSRLLLRHARKYLRYKRDLLSGPDKEEVATGIKDLEQALRQRDRENIRSAAETLDRTLHRLTPVTWESHWRENCEVILVAIVVAVGIRSYFLQPFKIPTGSMQPTLNGIIGYPSTAPLPNILRRTGDFFVLGRNYINVVSREDNQVMEVQSRKFLFFFTWSRIILDHPVDVTAPNILGRLVDFLRRIGEFVSLGCYYIDNEINVYCPPETLGHDFNVFPGRTFHRGEIIARGSVDTGDQVFVDKFSYNFVKPHRGHVFVFRTKHIFGIREDPQTGSPFYIKRLVGLPGDTLRIDPPLLYIDGKIAQGFGFARVMAAKAPYRGYALGRDYLAQPSSSFTVPERGYFALGDNSYNSYDSRYWGPVPEENLVGRGSFVYWPFNQHWGLIR